MQITAQHHDRFAMWDSAITKWNIKKVGGSNRDVVGELAVAVRAQGMKFGVSNHILYGYSFQWCSASADKSVDLYDPQYYDLYGDHAGFGTTAKDGPPNGGCAIGTGCMPGQPNQGFMNDWLARSEELIDKYQPDIQWFDGDAAGANHPTKLAVASYYYNAACGWGKDVAIAGKANVFPGDDTSATGGNVMIHDFETPKNAPAKGAEPKSLWFVDLPIGNQSWGYVTGMTYKSASHIVNLIKDYKSRGGMLILNISPMGDGSIPQAQIDILTAIGTML